MAALPPSFLRYEEVAKLRCCDVTFGPQNMVIRILSSKIDRYRQGDRVLVARTSSPACPVAMLERYYKLASISTQSKLRLNCCYEKWVAAPFSRLIKLQSFERIVFK